MKTKQANEVSYFAADIIHGLAQATLGLKLSSFSAGRKVYHFADTKSTTLFKRNVTALKFGGIKILLTGKKTEVLVEIK